MNWLKLYLSIINATNPKPWKYPWSSAGTWQGWYMNGTENSHCLCFGLQSSHRCPTASKLHRWWDPISPIRITNHVRHFCDTFATIWDNSRSRMTKDDKKATLCDHLRCLIPFYNTLQCSLSLLWPFLTFSDAFRPFVTFLDFTLFTLPVCVAFSGTFHQTLFTWLVHHSFGFLAIISVQLALCFADISCFILLL